jgi:hypothetical protein
LRIVDSGVASTALDAVVRTLRTLYLVLQVLLELRGANVAEQKFCVARYAQNASTTTMFS